MSDLVGVVRSLPEALGNTVREPDGVVYQSGHRGDQATILDAASLLAGLFAECPNCQGTGLPQPFRPDMIDYENLPPSEQKCPSCRGGVVIKPDIIEKAAKALVGMFASEGGGGVEWPEWSDLFDSEAEMWRDRARAALWAVLGGEE